MRPGSSLDSIVPDRASPVALHQQLYQKLRALIEARVLPHGTALPATRALAQDLRLGRNTVIAAYDQLALEGFLLLRRGTPPTVRELPVLAPPGPNPGPPASARLSRRGAALASQPFHHCEPGVTAFHPGLPDADEFPFQHLVAPAHPPREARPGRPLRDLLHHRLPRAPRSDRALPHRLPRRHLRRGPGRRHQRRAVVLRPPGAAPPRPGRQGLDGGAGLLRRRLAFVAAGARLAPLHVGDAGWRLEPPGPPAPRAIFVTPSCHHPLGLTMSMGQRLDLIRLAERWGSWIIEDDYDSEYRFQGQPIPALQGVTPGGRIDLRRHLRQDPLPGDAPRLHGGAPVRSSPPSRPPSARPASTPPSSPRQHSPTSSTRGT